MDIKLQTGLNSFGSLVLLGGQWLISVCLVRVSGYEDAGVFALAMTIANVFSMAANYGLRNFQLTDQKRVLHQRQYHMMRLLSSVIAVVVCLLYLHIGSGYSRKEIWAVMLYLLYNISIVFHDSLMTSIQLKDHLEYNGYSDILRGVLCLAFFVVALLHTKNLIPSLGMMLLASSLVLLLFDVPCYLKYCREDREPLRACFRGSLSLYPEGFPVMVSSMIPMIITAYPRTVLKTLLGAESLGYFSSVFTPAVILSTVVPPALIAFLPSIAAGWRENDDRGFLRGVMISYGISASAIVIALAGSLLLGRLLLVFLYGSSIEAYTYLLHSSVVAVGMSCICVCGHNIIVSVGQKRRSALFSCIALLIILVFSKGMISEHGIDGAVYVQIAAYGIQAVVQILYLTVCYLKHRKGPEFG